MSFQSQIKKVFLSFFYRTEDKSASRNLEKNESESVKQNEELPFWCATAKVRKDNIYGEERIVRKGTKHFRGGAKVYVADAYNGMCESVTIIGHHRSNSRFVKMDIHIKRLENFRLELVYSPKVLELIKRNFEEKYNVSGGYTKEFAENLVEVLPGWIESFHKGK